jgi:hypothetical protein
MVLGLWMVNVVFSLGHRLLNFQSARVTYFVNASLFIYLVHHPLTLLYGAGWRRRSNQYARVYGGLSLRDRYCADAI